MRTIYLDMDGVVADWTEGVAQFIGYRLDDPTVKYPDVDWQKIRSHMRLFRDLPKMPQADQMVDLARKFRDEFGFNLIFLTAIPHYNDVHWAFWDKMLWAQERYPDIPVHFGPYSEDKKKHCVAGDILVDDRPDNCQSWREASGVAVRVTKDYQAALNELEEIYQREQTLLSLI
jgi:5'(3')-deoxyribonucleotidase